jgi:hypothetical protein
MRLRVASRGADAADAFAADDHDAQHGGWRGVRYGAGGGPG